MDHAGADAALGAVQAPEPLALGHVVAATGLMAMALPPPMPPLIATSAFAPERVV